MLASQPYFSSSFAGLSCVAFTVFFVTSLYVFPIKKNTASGSGSKSSKSTLPNEDRNGEQSVMDRNHPLVIQQRCKGILLSSVVIPIYLWVVFSVFGVLSPDLPWQARAKYFMQLLGITIPGSVQQLAMQIVAPSALVAVLFMGPLLMLWLDQELPFQARFRWAPFDWIYVRNFIVGPVSEEFVFRSCMVAITSHAGASLRGMVFGLPLVFGIAHLHHGYESYVKLGRTKQAMIRSGVIALVQLTYTTLFGWFATFVFLRTSSLLAVCLSHTLCNVMGFPDLSSIEDYRHWKKWIYGAFVAGMVLFGMLVGPWTDPTLFGDASVSVYWPVVVSGVE
ncbi:hypothetical protein BGZ72_008690 [Mortierella alpina]|nr:hypothetical protein BGZ72_008690 [Mortierella alpina]